MANVDLKFLRQEHSRLSAKLQRLLDYLGITQEDLKKHEAEDFVECPVNSNHRMPAKALEAHVFKY
jgi:hypothetical protein